MKKILLILLLCLPANSYAAAPACIAKAVKASAPYGKASLSKFFIHVYDAQYWSDYKAWDMKQPSGLHLKYFVSIDSEDFVERTLDELDNNPSVDDAMKLKFKKILPKLMPNVKDGDRISAIFVPKSGLEFCHNNKYVGVIKDVKMSQAFMAIWLGKHTSEPSMRKQLLKL